MCVIRCFPHPRRNRVKKRANAARFSFLCEIEQTRAFFSFAAMFAGSSSSSRSRKPALCSKNLVFCLKERVLCINQQAFSIKTFLILFYLAILFFKGSQTLIFLTSVENPLNFSFLPAGRKYAKVSIPSSSPVLKRQTALSLGCSCSEEPTRARGKMMQFPFHLTCRQNNTALPCLTL